MLRTPVAGCPDENRCQNGQANRAVPTEDSVPEAHRRPAQTRNRVSMPAVQDQQLFEEIAESERISISFAIADMIERAVGDL
jgi:hypothetical protein